MVDWTDITLAYTAYLVGLAGMVPRFAHARGVAVAVLLVAAVLWWWSPGSAPASTGDIAVRWIVVPSLALLATYRVSGTFFVRPSPALERALLGLDVALLHGTGVLRRYHAAPRLVREIFEAFYVLVYVVVPLGATVLLIGGHRDALGGYWATVFASEVACYAALPWLQSRPPRAIETPGGIAPGPVRRLNLWLLRHGSIQVNTIPSAHAAGAIAVAFAVQSAMPSAGLVLLLVGTLITCATVLGRYHYALDSILGVVVALVAWWLVGGQPQA